MEPRKAGYEAGIMRQQPTHPYIVGTTPAREFMEGFTAGRAKRVWLDERGMKRIRQNIKKADGGGWHWEVVVEHNPIKQGWSKTEKLASQAAEDVALTVN